MRISFTNTKLERLTIAVNLLAAAVCTATFVLLFGFYEPLLPYTLLYSVQGALLVIFIGEKVVRFFNAVSKREYIEQNWFEIPLLIGLLIAVVGAGRWFGEENPRVVLHSAVGVYLFIQVVIKSCKTTVNLAASGVNPTRTLIVSFVVLITTGAGLLMLPRSAAQGKETLGVVDSFFTATSATCVTGLVVKNTGEDFSLMGQLIILGLIQLGGLGIVIFGAVIALLLGQALTLRESVAMQDLLSARTLGRIGNIIAFIFVGTILIEAIGAVTMFGMWDNVPGRIDSVHEQWFCTIFHSISAFCNAGFSLFEDSFVKYNRFAPVYLVICPLIILGGLGFNVLYNLADVGAYKIRHIFKKLSSKEYRLAMSQPRRLQLQTKIVLAVSGFLILFGMLTMLLFEYFIPGGTEKSSGGSLLSAFFQSVTARTAGFNTIDISSLSSSSKAILILLMFIGGSPGSAAGGIKTVTLAVIAGTAWAALRKRQDVELFERSLRLVVVGRAITITLLFVMVLFIASLALSITEARQGFTMGQILFESASALGTVGLTTGITGSLTTVGKLIIISVMLIGRLGPLTLLAALTFNLKPTRYSYPEEAVIVG